MQISRYYYYVCIFFFFKFTGNNYLFFVESNIQKYWAILFHNRFKKGQHHSLQKTLYCSILRYVYCMKFNQKPCLHYTNIMDYRQRVVLKSINVHTSISLDTGYLQRP